jgi:cell wall-associated NlpC family hydrolase
MKKYFSSVRVFLLKKKIRRVLATELAVLLLLIAGVVASQDMFQRVQASDERAAVFMKTSAGTELNSAIEDAASDTEKKVTEHEAAVRKARKEAEKKRKAAAHRKYCMSVVNYAKKYVGYNYVLGGSEMSKTPGKGLDCAGFVNYVFDNGPAHKNWKGMSVSALYSEIGGKHVSESDMQPGDIIFFSGKSHVAIYAGNGQIVHAMNAENGIVCMDLYTSSGSTYSGKEIIDVRRVL